MNLSTSTIRDVYAIAHNLEKLHQKLMKTNHHVLFLKRCKKEGVIPKGMCMKNNINNNKNDKILEDAKRKMRNNVLQWRYKQRRHLMIDIKTQEKILHIYMNEIHPERQHTNDMIWMNKYDKNKKDKLEKKHKEKLQNLILKQKPAKTKENPKIKIDTTNVINQSNEELTKCQLNVLSKGLKFAVTPKSINIINIITNVESSICTEPTIPKITKQLAVSEISTFIKQWKKPKIKNNNISYEEQQAIRKLKNNDNIIVVQADKGGKIVVMNKNDYIKRIEDKLNDKSIYEEVKDPTNIIKNKIAKLTNRLFKYNRINQHTKHELSSIDDIPHIRGQPKLHKKDQPMRLITNTKNTILSPLSKFGFLFIKELRGSIKNTICNTSQFLNDISKIKMECDDNFINLDVQDLFTNIPVTRAIDIAISKIGNSEKFCTSNLTITDLKQILLTSLNNNYCQFNEKFYKQKQGLPMGNTLSPILADLYMNEYMEKHMNKINKPLRIWRYVDDILVLTKMKEEEVKLYVENLNKIKSKIKFTYEYEENGRINFLDTTLSKSSDGKIDMKWYRKDSATDRLLNYNSYHDKAVKLNIIKNMTSKILETSKNPDQQQKDLNKLKEILKKSQYPSEIVNKNIIDTIRMKNQKVNKETQNNKKDETTKYKISLPFVQGINVLKRKLEKLKIKVFFSYPNKIQTLCTNTIKSKSKSNIYQINCSCGAVYNGETKVGLRKRISQHKTTIKKNDKTSPSEIAQHHIKNENKCIFDLNKAFIIDHETRWKRRRIKEAIYSTVNNSINRRNEINEIWLPLLHDASTHIKHDIEKRRMKSLSKVEQQDGDSGTEEEES